MAPASEREKNALAVLGCVPLCAQLLVHVWEESSAFGGRQAFVDRHATTSTGLATVLETVLFVLPLLAWAVLLARALVRRDPIPGQARDGDGSLARALGGVIRYVSPLAVVFLAVHVAATWGVRVASSETPLRAYDFLEATTGRPAYLLLYGVGIPAVLWHLAATLPDGLEALGFATRPDSRQSARIVSTVLALCLLVLYAQLAGWFATGTGTLWPIVVVPPGASAAP